MTAESVSSPCAPNAGRNRCSTSSADIAPPPPCPIWIVGESSSGNGQLQPARSGRAPAVTSTSATGGLRLEKLQPPVEVVGRAGALGADHRGAEWIARCALAAEGGALVRFDQPLQHLAGAADRGLLGGDALDIEADLSVEVAVGLGQPPAAGRDDADAAPGPVGDLEDVAQHLLGRRVPLR